MAEFSCIFADFDEVSIFLVTSKLVIVTMEFLLASTINLVNKMSVVVLLLEHCCLLL